MHTEIVLRFLTDVRRISDAVAALAAGDCPFEGAGAMNRLAGTPIAMNEISPPLSAKTPLAKPVTAAIW